jgi:glutamate transport system permease protein
VFNFLIENIGVYWDGFLVVVRLSLLSFFLALVIGVLIAACRVSPVPPLQRFAAAYVSVFRNTPLLAILFLLYFGGPSINLQFPSFTTAVIGLGLYTGAYMAETVRSGINSVSKGQAEAARSIGLPFRQILSQVVMPQAMRTVVPPIGNLFIANAKNTAIVLTIGVTDLTAVVQRLINRTGEAFAAVGAAAVFYVIYLLLASQVFAFIEKRVEIKR